MRTTTTFLLSALLATLFLSGCSQLVSNKTGDHSISSSLVDFLYPNKNAKEQISQQSRQQTPVLKLPLKVGLAFIPSRNWRGDQISENSKLKLLSKVKRSFEKKKFIDSITIIPSVYLRGGTGFNTLDRVSRLHDIDVIALVSYDQLTQSKHNNASLLYWTIVGMYVIPGNSNKVQTFVDTAVFDIRSRKLLLRAPGINSLSNLSTAIGVDRVIAQKSMQGFNLAFDEMIKNLDDELERFKESVKQGKHIKIQHKQGYSSGTSGGGTFGGLFLLLSLGFLLLSKRLWSK